MCTSSATREIGGPAEGAGDGVSQYTDSSEGIESPAESRDDGGRDEITGHAAFGAYTCCPKLCAAGFWYGRAQSTSSATT